MFSSPIDNKDDDKEDWLESLEIESVENKNDTWGYQPNMASLSNKMFNEGYRQGRVKAEEVAMQRGFNDGLIAGVRLGQLCGNFYALVRLKYLNNDDVESSIFIERIETNSKKILLKEIEVLLFDDIPHTKFKMNDSKVQNIRSLILLTQLIDINIFEEFLASIETQLVL
eukprot:gene6487-8920_t